MRLAALLCAVLPLAGCAVVRHVQVLPVINPDLDDVSCCMIYAEVPPATQLSATLTHSDEKGTKVKLGAHWRF